MKKIICACFALILLVGCNQAKESVQEQTNTDTASMDSFDDSYYKIIKPESGDSELREGFYLEYGTKGDFKTIGRGLQILSADYFSTSNHYMSEGQYLKLSLKDEMLTRKSEYSIQPSSGTIIEGVTDPIMVQNIQEQDYFVRDGSSYSLKGVAFAIVLEPTTSDGKALESPMSHSAIESYGKECIKRFYDIIKTAEEFEKIKDLPILISVYRATDTSSSTTDGNYILKSYCQKGLGEINKVNHENVLFTSPRAEELDKTTYSDFNAIKTSLKNASTEAAGFVGEGRYVNDEIQSMVITANLNVKSSTELMYLTSIIADGLDNKFTYDFKITVLVNSQDQLQAVIVKDKGEKSKSTDLY